MEQTACTGSTYSVQSRKMCTVSHMFDKSAMAASDSCCRTGMGTDATRRLLHTAPQATSPEHRMPAWLPRGADQQQLTSRGKSRISGRGQDDLVCSGSGAEHGACVRVGHGWGHKWPLYAVQQEVAESATGLRMYRSTMQIIKCCLVTLGAGRQAHQRADRGVTAPWRCYLKAHADTGTHTNL